MNIEFKECEARCHTLNFWAREPLFNLVTPIFITNNEFIFGEQFQNSQNTVTLRFAHVHQNVLDTFFYFNFLMSPEDTILSICIFNRFWIIIEAVCSFYLCYSWRGLHKHLLLYY